LLTGLGVASIFLFTPAVAGQTGVFVLNPAGEGEFSGTVEVRTSNLNVNGNFKLLGDANVRASVANVGTITNPDNFTGLLVEGVTNTEDPLASLPTPTFDPTLDLGTVNLNGGSTELTPGFYSGGISLTSSAIVFLDPGLYVLDGVGLDMGGQSSIFGQGVTLFITGTGTVNMSGGGSVNLTPPDSGVYRDVLLFVDRDAAGSVIMFGGGEFKTNGKMYAPSSIVDIGGTVSTGGDPNFGWLLVAKDLRLSGTGTILFLRLPNGEGAYD
jgi:hypothetical protein